MNNRYIKNLSKLEFVITYACTGRCKHCSQGEHSRDGAFIDPVFAANTIKAVTEVYDIKTVMTFGGEPLLHPETVCAIHRAATQARVEKRQLITNDFFTRSVDRMADIVRELENAGVNEILLSVDSFHAETIPMDTVKHFAIEVMKSGVPIRTQPAWLVSKDDNNPYNRNTKELLSEFHSLGIEENDGNIIFPEGNALVYLKDYFDVQLPENPYIEDPENVRCLSFGPDGSVLGKNTYTSDIMEILENYDPNVCSEANKSQKDYFKM